MDILYKQGDLTQAEEYIIAHGCNAQGKMGSGVAKAIRREFPQAYSYYRSAYEYDDPTSPRNTLTVGKIVWAPDSPKKKLIANCITQEHYGYDGHLYVDYDAIRKCMWALNAEAKVDDLGPVAMPRIGCGLAGGDWNIVSKIIMDEFTDVTPVVYDWKEDD